MHHSNGKEALLIIKLLHMVAYVQLWSPRIWN